MKARSPERMRDVGKSSTDTTRESTLSLKIARSISLMTSSLSSYGDITKQVNAQVKITVLSPQTVHNFWYGCKSIVSK